MKITLSFCPWNPFLDFIKTPASRLRNNFEFEKLTSQCSRSAFDFGFKLKFSKIVKRVFLKLFSKKVVRFVFTSVFYYHLLILFHQTYFIQLLKLNYFNLLLHFCISLQQNVCATSEKNRPRNYRHGTPRRL